MAERKIVQLIPAVAMSEGAGVTVHRTLGTPARRHLDPFLMLDHFGTDDPDQYIAGFPDHPHRGFVTLTYMIDGHMLHRDSMGNEGDLRTGGVQWMKAASGVIHSEMPQQTSGRMRGFQLWINLPATEKMSAPEYQNLAPSDIPLVKQDGTTIKVIAGSYQGTGGPIHDPHTDVHYFDVALASGKDFSVTLPPDYTALAYVYEGQASIGDTILPTHSLAIFGAGERLTLASRNAAGRFVLVAGRPLNEPIAQYGPFVMNTSDEIHQAFDDYRNGRLVRTRAHIAS
jgi:quercetin 2,3-dioxygenase